MKRRARVEALILSRRSQGEADRLLTFFTPDQGILKVLAKGVRRIPSRRGGHVEALARVTGILHGKPGHYFLAGVETLDYHVALRQDVAALEQVRILNQLLVRLLPL